MPRRIHLEPHLTADELSSRYRRASDPVERSHWHFLWLLAGGMTATAVAAVAGYSAYWIGKIASAATSTAQTGCEIDATRRLQDSLTCRPHTSRHWRGPWLARTPRATAGADGP
jgi:hypothetical protein